MEQEVKALLHDEIIYEALKYWGGNKDSFSFVSAVENFVYEFTIGKKTAILRLTHSSHRTKEEVQAELDWIHYLQQHQANVCAPLFSQNQNLIEIFPATESYFIAAVFEKAPGNLVKGANPLEWNSDLFELWGKTIGHFHRLTKNFQPSSPKIKRHSWKEEDMTLNAAQYLPDSEKDTFALLEAKLSWLSQLPQDKESYGLVHTDVHLHNFFYHQGKIFVFDFDDACYHWFLYDIAIPIYYSIPHSLPIAEQENFSREFFLSFMKGYLQENHLASYWFSHLEEFLKFRDLVLYIFFFKKELEKGQGFYAIEKRVRTKTPCVSLNFLELYQSIETQ